MNNVTHLNDSYISAHTDAIKQRELDYKNGPKLFNEYSPLLPEYNKKIVTENIGSNNEVRIRTYYTHKDSDINVVLNFCNTHLCGNNSYKIVYVEFVYPYSFNNLEYKLDKKTLELLVEYFTIPSSDWLAPFGIDIRKFNTLVKKGILDYSNGKYWWRTTLGKQNDLMLSEKVIGADFDKVELEYRYFTMYINREDFSALEKTRKEYIEEYRKFLGVSVSKFNSMLFYGLWSLAA